MDYWKALRELYLERQKIEKAIRTLEAVQQTAENKPRKAARVVQKARRKASGA